MSRKRDKVPWVVNHNHHSITKEQIKTRKVIVRETRMLHQGKCLMMIDPTIIHQDKCMMMMEVIKSMPTRTRTMKKMIKKAIQKMK